MTGTPPKTEEQEPSSSGAVTSPLSGGLAPSATILKPRFAFDADYINDAGNHNQFTGDVPPHEIVDETFDGEISRDNCEHGRRECTIQEMGAADGECGDRQCDDLKAAGETCDSGSCQSAVTNPSITSAPEPTGEVAALLAELKAYNTDEATPVDPNDYWVRGKWDLEGLKSDVAIQREELGIIPKTIILVPAARPKPPTSSPPLDKRPDKVMKTTPKSNLPERWAGAGAKASFSGRPDRQNRVEPVPKSGCSLAPRLNRREGSPVGLPTPPPFPPDCPPWRVKTHLAAVAVAKQFPQGISRDKGSVPLVNPLASDLEMSIPAAQPRQDEEDTVLTDAIADVVENAMKAAISEVAAMSNDGKDSETSHKRQAAHLAAKSQEMGGSKRFKSADVQSHAPSETSQDEKGQVEMTNGHVRESTETKDHPIDLEDECIDVGKSSANPVLVDEDGEDGDESLAALLQQALSPSEMAKKQEDCEDDNPFHVFSDLAEEVVLSCNASEGTGEALGYHEEFDEAADEYQTDPAAFEVSEMEWWDEAAERPKSTEETPSEMEHLSVIDEEEESEVDVVTQVIYEELGESDVDLPDYDSEID